MKIEEYLAETGKGSMIICGRSQGGIPMVAYATSLGSVEMASEGCLVALSTGDATALLEKAKDGLMDYVKTSEDFIGLLLDTASGSYRMVRKAGSRSDVWTTTLFPGFGHILSEGDDGNPVTLELLPSVSSVADRLWRLSPETRHLYINLDGGVRELTR